MSLILAVAPEATIGVELYGVEHADWVATHGGMTGRRVHGEPTIVRRRDGRIAALFPAAGPVDELNVVAAGLAPVWTARHVDPRLTAEPEAVTHASLAAGLRELADFIEANCDLPLPQFPQFSYPVNTNDDSTGAALVEQAAQVLDVKADDLMAERMFGVVEVQIFHVREHRLREYQALTSYSGNFAEQPVNGGTG